MIARRWVIGRQPPAGLARGRRWQRRDWPGADVIIVDDPIKSREEANSLAYRDRVFCWWTDDLYTRLEPGAAIILILTRWHMDDLAGRILASEDAPNWTVVSLPAFAEANDPPGCSAAR